MHKKFLKSDSKSILHQDTVALEPLPSQVADAAAIAAAC